jgi:hypothetical protein
MIPNFIGLQHRAKHNPAAPIFENFGCILASLFARPVEEKHFDPFVWP